MDIKREKKQTFIVEIIDHQKSTWQGQIHWVQGNRKISFRSVLEMLHLIDSVIGEGEDGKWGTEAGTKEE